MNNILFLLTLKPILYGLIGIVISGISFPLAGVIILRNNLISMRYMLMHTVILGGILSIALGLPLLATVIPLNIVLIIIIALLNRDDKTSLGTMSTVMMVITMGSAALLSHIFDVPAKDTLEILWGSPFALTSIDLAVLIILGICLVFYVCVFFRPLSMIFFDRDTASSSGVNVKFHSTVMLLITALTISLAMKMVGALLIDALVVLPVASSSRNSKSLKELFIKSSLTGLLLSVTGYFAALWLNLPVSGLISCAAVLLFAIYYIIEKLRK